MTSLKLLLGKPPGVSDFGKSLLESQDSNA